MDSILNEVKKLIEQCEGAIMVARGGDYLHNFSFCMQDKLKQLAVDLERFS